VHEAILIVTVLALQWQNVDWYNQPLGFYASLGRRLVQFFSLRTINTITFMDKYFISTLTVIQIV